MKRGANVSDTCLMLKKLVALCLSLFLGLLNSSAHAACSDWIDKAWLNEYQHGSASFLEIYSTQKTFPASWQGWSIKLYEKNNAVTTYQLNNGTAFACTKAGNKTWVTHDVPAGLPGTEGLLVLFDALGKPVDAFAFDNNAAPPAPWKNNTDNYYLGLVGECSTLASRLTDQATAPAPQINTTTSKYMPNMLYAADQGNKDYSRTPDGGGNPWFETSYTGAGTTYTTCTSNNANLTKTIDVTDAPPGGTINYTISLANPSASSPITVGATPDPLVLSITDILPATGTPSGTPGLVFVDAHSSVASDQVIKPAVGSSGGTVIWNPVTIPAGGRTVLTITLAVPTNAPVGTVYDNTANATGTALMQSQTDSVSFTVVSPTTRSFLIQPDRQTSCRNTSSPFAPSSYDPIVTITAKDQINGTGNTLTNYVSTKMVGGNVVTGSVTLGTSSSSNAARWSKVPGFANGTLTLTASGATYNFVAADNGVAKFYLGSSKAETIDVTATDLDTYAPSVMTGIFSSITYASTCPNVPLISVGDAAVTEGNTGAKVLNFPVTLSQSSASAITVTYATTNITATAGSDYVAASGTLTIPAGTTSTTIPVTIYGDLVFEGNETFSLSIANPTNAILGVATATATILNDDPAEIRADYWMDRDDWSGSVLVDKSGKGNDATIRSAIPSAVGNASAYPALTVTPSTCGYADLSPANASLELSSGLGGLPISGKPGYTITAWVKAGSATGKRHIVSNDDGTNGWALTLENGVLGFTKSNITLDTLVDGGSRVSGTEFATSANLSGTEWHFVALTVNTESRTVVVYSYGNTTGNTAYTSRATATYSGTWNSPATGKSYIGGYANTNYFQGSIDEVRIYDGALPQNEIELIRLTTRTCAMLDHIRIEHNGSALTCLREPVTIKACRNSDCSSLYTGGTVSLTLTPAGWYSTQTGGVSANSVSINGSAVMYLQNSTVGDVILSANTITPTPSNSSPVQCVGGLAGDLCRLTFSDAGLIFTATNTGNETTIPSQIAGKPFGATYLRAVKSDKITGACVAALTSGRSVSLTYACDTPACSSGNYMSVNGGSLFGPSPTGTSVNLSFDSNGYSTSAITPTFFDAGKIHLTASTTADTGGALRGSSNAFVVRPAGLCVYSTDLSHCAAADISCPAVRKAGEAFNLSVKAVTWESDGDSDLCTVGNLTTPNYQASGITLGSSLVAPSGGTPGSVGTTSLDITGSGTASTNQSISEVGVFKFSAQPSADYIDPGVSVGGPFWTGNFGRFIPDHFVMTGSLINRQGSSCAPPSSFTYMGEPFRVSLVLTAEREGGGTTLNYDTGRGFARLDAASAIWLNIGANSTLGIGAVQGTTPLSTRLSSTGTPSGTWSLGTATLVGDLVLSRPITTTADATWGPYATLQIGAAPQDADGVTLLSSALNMDADVSGASERQQIGTTSARLGRLLLFNAFGTEKADLAMPVQAQYWTGKSWIVNSDDSCTRLPENAFNTPAGVGVSGIVSIGGGQGTLWLNNPAKAIATVDIALNLGATGSGSDTSCLTSHGGTPANLPWLRGIYPTGSACPGTNVDPSARATFGLYLNPEKRKAIHIRETY